MPAVFRFSILLEPRLPQDGGGYIASAAGWPTGGTTPPPTGATAAEVVAAFEPLMTDWVLANWSVDRPPPSLTVAPKD